VFSASPEMTILNGEGDGIDLSCEILNEKLHDHPNPVSSNRLVWEVGDSLCMLCLKEPEPSRITQRMTSCTSS
jgi:hypothetical protein